MRISHLTHSEPRVSCYYDRDFFKLFHSTSRIHIKRCHKSWQGRNMSGCCTHYSDMRCFWLGRVKFHCIKFLLIFGMINISLIFWNFSKECILYFSIFIVISITKWNCNLFIYILLINKEKQHKIERKKVYKNIIVINYFYSINLILLIKICFYFKLILF